MEQIVLVHGIIKSRSLFSRETLLKCPACTPGRHRQGECPTSEFYAFTMVDMLSHIQRWHPEMMEQEEEGEAGIKRARIAAPASTRIITSSKSKH